MSNEYTRIKDNLFNLQVKIVETKRQFILTLCIICGATAGFSAGLLNSSVARNKDFLLGSICLLLFAIASGIFSLKRDVEQDMTKLNNLADLINENNSEKIKAFAVKENKDKGLDYTFDLMVYPFIGSLVAILLAFIVK